MRQFPKDDQALLATWALDCAERVLPLFRQARPADLRPAAAIAAGRDWVRTRQFSMASIRTASLAAHAAAKAVPDDAAAAAAAHAAGQAVGTAHVTQHAYGGAYYALLAVLAAYPGDDEAFAAEQERQAAGLPDHLRDEVIARLVVERRRGAIHVSIDKGAGF